MSTTPAIDFSKYEQQASTPKIDFSKYEGAAPAAAQPNEDTGVLASLKRSGSSLIHLPGAIVDAFTKPAQNDQEKLVETLPVAGQQLPPAIALGLHRLVVAPMVAEAQKADDLRQQAKTQTPDQANNAYNGTEHLANMHQLASMFPVVGPMAADITQRYLSGDKSGAVTDLATAIAGPKLAEGAVGGVAKSVTKAAPQLAETMYQSALKPSTTLSVAERSNIVKTGLDAGIPVSAAGADKLSGLIDDLNSKVKAQIQAGADAGATIDPQAIAKRLDQTKAKFANQVTPESDLAAIDAAREEFLRRQGAQATAQSSTVGSVSGAAADTKYFQQAKAQLGPDASMSEVAQLAQKMKDAGAATAGIPVDDAQAMKTGTYQQLKGRAYGELKSATVEAQKSLARGIKEELETQFPEIKNLNAQESKFYDLDGVLERALNRIGNHQLVGIGTPIVTGAATGLGGTLFGHGAEGAAVGLAAGAIKAVLDNPIVKSKLAIILNKAGRGSIPMAAANGRVADYVNGLSQAANGLAKSAGPQVPMTALPATLSAANQ